MARSGALLLDESSRLLDGLGPLRLPLLMLISLLWLGMVVLGFGCR